MDLSQNRTTTGGEELVVPFCYADWGDKEGVQVIIDLSKEAVQDGIKWQKSGTIPKVWLSNSTAN